jgi:hypothetical protein
LIFLHRGDRLEARAFFSEYSYRITVGFCLEGFTLELWGPIAKLAKATVCKTVIPRFESGSGLFIRSPLGPLLRLTGGKPG